MSWLSSIWNSGPGWILTRFTRFTFLGLFFGKSQPWINWTPSPNFGFAMAHLFCGGWFLYLLKFNAGWNWLAASIVLTLVAAIKEFIIDIKIIEGDGYLSSAWDFATYMIGVWGTAHFIRHLS